MSASEPPGSSAQSGHDRSFSRLRNFLRLIRRPRNGESLRETIDEMIEEPAADDADSLSGHERLLIGNVLKIHDQTAADVMVPLRTASSAFAPELIAATMISAAKKLRMRSMTASPIVRIHSALGRCAGDGFEIGDDCIDLHGIEVILETGHARRAVADNLAHDAFLSARGVLRQFRPVERARHLRLGMADAARLVEQPHAEKLLVRGHPIAAGLLRRCTRERDREYN